MMHTAVIGGGPMGLATAMELARSGMRVTLFEADDVLGGMSASFDFDGVQIERFYHFINRPDVSLFELLRELGLENDLHWTPTRMGLFRPPPQSGPSQARLLPWDGPLALLRFPDASLFTRLRYGMHVLLCKHLRDLNALDDISAKDWICRWQGKESYDLLWRFLFEKKFFEYADPLSAAWIAARVHRAARSRSGFQQEQLGYLTGGTQSLLERMAAAITEHGGSIRLSTPVEKVLPSENGSIAVRTVEKEETFDALVSTIPLPYIAKIMPGLPEKYLDRIKAMRNVGCACVLVRLQRPLTPYFWLNTAVQDWHVPGIIEYSNLRPMEATYVYVPFYMPHSHANWKADDQTLLNTAHAYLRAINADAARTADAARVFRYEWAQPVCPPGAAGLIPDYATGVDNIWVADTTHSFPQDRSINESVRIGRELAQRALRARS